MSDPTTVRPTTVVLALALLLVSGRPAMAGPASGGVMAETTAETSAACYVSYDTTQVGSDGVQFLVLSALEYRGSCSPGGTFCFDWIVGGTTHPNSSFKENPNYEVKKTGACSVEHASYVVGECDLIESIKVWQRIYVDDWAPGFVRHKPTC